MWRKCSSCKNPIEFRAKYYTCSVSSCNGLRTGYVFCSVPCFERHLPGARHRDAGAMESTAPSSSSGNNESPSRRIIPNQSASSAQQSAGSSSSTEVLVIASRIKDHIQKKSEFNTSGNVMDALSQHLRIICERAIDNARADGRKTVMDRDFKFLSNLHF